MDLHTYALVKKKALTDLPGVVDDWLSDHVDPETGYVLDDTLALENAAAPAKTVGDALTAQSEKIDEAKTAISNAPSIKVSTKTDVDLDVSDINGNVLVRFEDGHIETKEFNSRIKETKVKTSNADSDVDLDIADTVGNVLVRFENGEIHTKKLDLTNEFYVPKYYFPYLDNKCERIKQLMLESGGDAFFFITDQHQDKGNAHQSFKLINYIAKKCRINKLFLGGDLDNGVNIEWADEYRRAIGGRMYACCGNHEYMDSQGVTEENLTYALEAATDDEISGDPYRRYFYVDNPKKKVRYIVLNGFKENDASTSWSQGYEQEQEDWLTGTALVVESDWTIVVFSHAFYDVADMRYPVLTQLSWTKHILDAIDDSAYAENVACIISGHSHMDAIEATDDGIPILITTCDKYAPYDPQDTGQEYWLANRVPGTVTEQAFEVCVLDTVNKKLTAVRIGGFNTGNDETDEELFEVGEQIINYDTEVEQNG